MPQITIKQGRKQVGTPFLFSPVKDPIISIGRHPSNDIKLKDAKRQVSRHHAAVILDSKDRYFAQDLGSMNGISLNGNPVYRKLLKDGDILSVGGFDLVFTEKDVKQAKLMVPIISEDKAGVPIQTERYTDIPTAPHVNESILLTRLTPERQAVFQDIAKRLQFMADRDQILQDILDSVCHAAEADKAYIAMMDESSVLWVSTLFGIDVDRGDQVPGLAQSWIDSVIANEAPYHMQNLQGTGTVIACHPLWAGDGLIGIVFMNRKEGFSQNDLDFITIVLEHARIPIQQASVSGTRQRETTHSDEGLSWKTRLVGNTKTESMKEVYQSISVLAPKPVNILLLGETGVGKEVFAHEIHARSERQNGPFVALELSALPSEDMAASELFGHVKGAFTGAVNDKKGKFEMAHGGTLFLDEIGDISLESQAKLRRAIENKEIAKIGEEKTVSVDIRIISATNRNLEKMISEGEFREDLYERLGAVLTLPPLKERKEDIPLLAHYFVSECGTTVKGISPKALQLLQNYDWPRNVRELRNCIEEAVARAQDKDMLYPWDLPDKLQEGSGMGSTFVMSSLKQNEFNEIMNALEQTAWNISQAADILGISRQTLYNKMKTYEIEKPG